MTRNDDIFGIGSDDAFARIAVETFRRQATQCPPYREYLTLIGIQPQAVHSPEQTPFLPIELFKSHDVYCGTTPPEIVFTSSATTGMTPARHPM